MLLISQVFATVLFFVCARYRMTSAPILCLFAGYAVVALARMIRGRRPGALAYGGIALVLALAVNVDAYGISQKRYSRPEYELALVERREGNTDETARLLEMAAAADAEDPDPPFQIGILKVGRGKYEEAATYFRAAADLEPRYSRSWFNLGFCQSRSGDVAGAANSFKRALEIEPTYWEAAMGLGDALLSEGEYTGAAATYGWSKDIVRNHGQAAVSAISHGRALALLGEYESSLAQFDEALGHAPGSVDARLAKARVLLALDRPQEAAREVWLAAASDSSNARVKAMIEELGIAAGAPGDD